MIDTVSGEAAADLVAALGELQEPAKGGRADTGSYAYTYLELPDLLAAVRPVFKAHGLAVLQEVCNDAADVEVTTVIVHKSGTVIRSAPLTLRSRGSVQDIGSAITYGRRYSLAALVGLTGAEDTDGAQTIPAGSDIPAPPPRPDSTPIPPPRDFTRGAIGPGTYSPGSFKLLMALLSERFPKDDQAQRAWVADVLGLEGEWSRKDLSQAQVSALIDRLNRPQEAS